MVFPLFLEGHPHKIEFQNEKLCVITPTFQHVIDSAILQETTPVPAAAVKSKATTESTAMKIANLLYTVQCAECRLLVALSSSKTIDSIHTPHVTCISVENNLCIYTHTRHISYISTEQQKRFVSSNIQSYSSKVATIDHLDLHTIRQLQQGCFQK